MELREDMTPEEIRAARRNALNEYRASLGAPPVHTWRDILTDPIWLSIAWVAVAFLLSGLGVNVGWAIIAPFVAMVVWVHGYRAFRRRQRSARRD